MLAKDIVKVNLTVPYRVICIADIHGSFTAFQRLLAKVNYKKGKDYLFILGDLLERGREEEIPTIDYIFELSKHDRVYIISGNNDRRMDYIQNEDFQEMANWIKIRPGNILTQWLNSIGISESEFSEENYKSAISEIKSKYRDKIDFVCNLPLVIETKEFICVHSSLDSREDWQETSKWDAWFGNIRNINKTGKWVIGGHAPNSCFFPEAQMTLLPIIRYNNKTISIDGGCNTVFFGGQLNALIIEKSSESEDIVFSFDCADSWSLNGIIIKNVKGGNEYEVFGEHLGNVEALKKGEHFTECKIIETGKICLVKNESVSGEIFDCWQAYNNFVSVNENEIVSVINNSLSGYAYIRSSKGELGWIPKDCLSYCLRRAEDGAPYARF